MDCLEKDENDKLEQLLNTYTNDIFKIQYLVNEEGHTLVHKCVQ